MASARASPALARRRSWRSIPSVTPPLGEGAQDPAVERALDQRPAARGPDARRRGCRAARRARRPATMSQPAARSSRAARASRWSSAGTSGAASSTGPIVAVQRGLGGVERGRLEARARRDLRGPAPRPRGELGTQRPRAVGAQQLVERRVVGRGERADDDGGHRRRARQSQEKCVPTGSGAAVTRGTAAASVRANVSVLACDQADELLDGRRRLGLDAVGVVGRVAEQRVGQLGLAGEDRLGPGRLGDRGDARRA